MSSVAEQIEACLRAAFSPEAFELRDDSALHARHPGARAGGGHYHLSITADAFAGKSTVQRHRMIYQALGELMKHDIHALAIKATTAAEATQATHS